MQRQLLAAPARVAAIRAAAGARQASTASSSTVGSTVYNVLFRRNVTYATYIFGGAIVLEAVYGNVLEGTWAALNKGVRGSGEGKHSTAHGRNGENEGDESSARARA
jgi:hypothetical protein